MSSLQTLSRDSEERMKRAVAAVTRELSEVRGGRATPALVEHVTVESYGTATPLKQLAAITAPEPRLLVIQPWDASLVAEVEKALLKASIGMTPAVDGKVVRLPVPSLTGERRQELIRLVHRLAEEGRVAVRNVRRDANEALKKFKSSNQATEDDVFKGQDAVQKLTDKCVAQIDALVKQKEQELSSA